MCGLAGEVRFDSNPADIAAVAAMNDRQRARGPDGEGLVAQGRAALGHRRLKIIDLSERAQQPMVDAALGLTLVFNGCIYNHRELRAELEGLGYRFFSDGDTEVVLKAWHAWRHEAPQRFNGMFAFAVFERDSGRLALARDRLGIKPLYLSFGDGGRRLRFASSLPALVAAGDVDCDVDPVALKHYMTFHAVVPPPRTILRGVAKLPPASVAIFEPDGRRKDLRYWSLAFERGPEDLRRPAEEWRRLLHDALRRSVQRRMLADVPVGVLLSGGVDSSLVVGLLAEAGQQATRTFSIGFEDAGGEAGNEFRYSDLVARHYATEHHRIPVAGERLLAALPESIAAMAEPMVSYDNVAFFLLSQEVSQHVKVVQSGQGADELFGGYHWYPPLLESNDAVGDYARVFFDRDHAEHCAAIGEAYGCDDEAAAFVAEHFAAPGAASGVDRALRLDSTIMLAEDPVKRVDSMTMAWGLEARVPFLDHEVAELAARIPPEQKLRDGGKGILKDVARQVIPEAVIDRPKGYFPVPALKYLEGPYLELVRDALAAPAARRRGLFAPAYVERLLAAPAEHLTPLRGSKLWQLGLLELWLQTHVDR